MNRWLIVVSLVAALGAAAGGYWAGAQAKDTAWRAEMAVAKAAAETKVAEAEQAARQKERTWQEKIDDIASRHRVEVGHISGERDAALERLRHRPERRPIPAGGVPPAAQSACQGSTGAELSRADAEFLVREAARADDIRSGLEDCYQVLDALR